MLNMMISTFPFYFVLLEQYYTGEMNFPPINGVDEGSLLYWIMCMVTGYYGSISFWTQKYKVFGGIYSLSFMFTKLLQHALPCASLVAMYMIYSKKHFSHFKQLWDPTYFTMQVLFYFISLFTFYFAEVYSVNQVWRTHNRAIQLGHGLQFIYISLILQYSHVTMEKVNPFTRTITLTWILLNINNYFMIVHGEVFFDEVSLYYFTNTYQLIAILY